MREKKPTPTYYAIIPANVRYSPISANAKLFYGELTALCTVKGYCWATNQYFATLYNVHKDTVSAWVQELVAHRFITVRQLKNERRMSLTVKTPRGLGENTEAPLGENTVHSITSSSNTVITDTEPSATPPVAPFDLEGTLKRWEDGKVRRFEILAWYIRGARLAAKSKQELENIKGRHIRSATRLEAYTDDELTGAWKKAQALGDKLGFAPTLDTVLKQLTQ